MHFNRENTGTADNAQPRKFTVDRFCQLSTTFNRFWAKVKVGELTECWLWIGTRQTTGYGIIRRNGKNLRAHRVAWSLVNGPIADGLDVLHKCDTPLCVNPLHLFLGTDADNHRDKAAKGRHWQQKKTHCPQGHEYSLENTYRAPSGGRKCLQCVRARAKRRSQ